MKKAARAVADKYLDARLIELEKSIFKQRGLDRDAFYKGQYGAINAHKDLVVSVDNLVNNFDYGVSLLVAGVDETGAHVFAIHNPGGNPVNYDHIGYNAVGSGAIHAIHSMIGFSHTSKKPLRETIFSVFSSKKRAEAAPGVGRETDILYIESQKITWLSEASKIRTLDKQYERLQNIDQRKMLAEVEKLM